LIRRKLQHNEKPGFAPGFLFAPRGFRHFPPGCIYAANFPERNFPRVPSDLGAAAAAS
jgi:hypothetical protein